MTNIDELFQTESRFLKAEDLRGKEVKVTIEDVGVEDFDDDGKTKAKPTISFKGKKKGIVCNKTNSMTIADAYGKDLEGWVGKEIILYPTKVSFAGEMVDAIRVRVPLEMATEEDEPPF